MILEKSTYFLYLSFKDVCKVKPQGWEIIKAGGKNLRLPAIIKCCLSGPEKYTEESGKGGREREEKEKRAI